MPVPAKRLALMLFAQALCCSAAQAEYSEYSLDHSELRAQLTPIRHATLSASMAGKIDQILVREGESFKAGAALITFDCALQKVQKTKASAELAGALNNFEGNQQLAQLNAIGTVELSNSEIAVRKAKADVEYLETTLQLCTVYAPYSGSAGEQLARAKEFVQLGQPLLEIQDDLTLELEFIVPSRWMRWLTPGYAFTVSIEDTDQSYPVKLSRTAAKVDPMSQTIKAVAIIDGQYPELLPGMSGRLDLQPPQ